MNIEILNLAKHHPNDRAKDIALPVLAIECEAKPFLDNCLDAYEETVLKLVSIGLSTRGIAITLNATESLIEEILDSLDRKKYAEKKTGSPWKLTESGEKFLIGYIEERESDNSQFGYMFVNAIKKEVLPFFYQGDLNHAPLFKGTPLPAKLTLNGNEETTFENYIPKSTRLKDAYKKYYRNSEKSKQYHEDEITLDEAADLFEGMDSFDEEDYTDVQKQTTNNDLSAMTNNMFIRPLNCAPKHVYLTMRIILDPQYPGGYRVESPFDFYGIDNGYYLLQIQWLAAAGSTFVGDENLDAFLTREIRHLAPSFTNSDKDFSVFVLEKMPLMKINRDRFNREYDDMARIYSLMRRQSSLLEEEHIVNSISRKIVESLYNSFFRGIKRGTLSNIQSKIKEDLYFNKHKLNDCSSYLQQITKVTCLDTTQFRWSYTLIDNSVGKLPSTHGNSIMEKLINVILLNYYCGTRETNAFLSLKNIQRLCELTDRLNQIRRKVAHDTDERFESKDYDFYMANSFTLINGLLEAFKEI